MNWHLWFSRMSKSVLKDCVAVTTWFCIAFSSYCTTITNDWTFFVLWRKCSGAFIAGMTVELDYIVESSLWNIMPAQIYLRFELCEAKKFYVFLTPIIFMLVHYWKAMASIKITSECLAKKNIVSNYVHFYRWLSTAAGQCPRFDRTVEDRDEFEVWRK